MEFLITSKRGMTPWATVSTPAAAIRESRRAKQHGLDGEIYPDGTDEELAEEIGAAGGYTGDWRTAGTDELRRRVIDAIEALGGSVE